MYFDFGSLDARRKNPMTYSISRITIITKVYASGRQRQAGGSRTRAKSTKPCNLTPQMFFATFYDKLPRRRTVSRKHRDADVCKNKLLNRIAVKYTRRVRVAIKSDQEENYDAAFFAAGQKKKLSYSTSTFTGVVSFEEKFDLEGNDNRTCVGNDDVCNGC